MSTADLPSIDDLLHDDPDCRWCLGCGMVCEKHPYRAWGPMIEPEPPYGFTGALGSCHCGAPGRQCPEDAPCPVCSDGPIPTWPERCPPHLGDQHLCGDEELVLDRPPTDEELDQLPALIPNGDYSLESMVAAFAQLGLRVVWMRRQRRTT